MSFESNIQDASIEKHSLLVFYPRIRATGWEDMTGGIWRVSFPHGYVTGVGAFTNDVFTESSTLAGLNTYGEYYYDRENFHVYVYTVTSPDAFLAAPGLNIEFAINVSDQAFTGPMDPRDAASPAVNWVPALKEIPSTQNGQRDTLYGFLPSGYGQASILNKDGWMNEILYGASFCNIEVSAYLVANSDLEIAILNGEVQEAYFGFANSIRLSNGVLTLQVAEYLQLLDNFPRLLPITNLSTGSNLEPSMRDSEYYLRRVYGVVEQLDPVNIDYGATPSTSNNRRWATNELLASISDGSNLDEGTIAISVDAANPGITTTRTYTLTTPNVNVFDSIIVERSGVLKYAFVTGVDYTLNYIDHTVVTGSPLAGDEVFRSFVGAIAIEDENGVFVSLSWGVDYNVYLDPSTSSMGFLLVNNFEANHSGAGFTSIFDPTKCIIYCRVYGHKGAEKYNDLSNVGITSKYGGTNGTALATAYRLLLEAGVPQEKISDTTFQAVEPDSFTIGITIPSSKKGSLSTYREYIQKILTSNLYRVGLVTEGNDLYIGINELQPISAHDYEINELNHRGFDFEQDYSQTYSGVAATYSPRERLNSAQGSIPNAQLPRASSSLLNGAFSLHGINKTLEISTALFSSVEAVKLVTRMSYAVGDRRAYYTSRLEAPYISKSNLGDAYKINRQEIPGAPYVYGVDRSINLVVTEVKKDSSGVIITFDDQKGVQDNALDW